MNELLHTQKILRRLKVLFAVFAAICIAAAALAAAAAVVWEIKGETYLEEGGFLARIAEALDFGDFDSTFGIFLTDAISFFALGFLLAATSVCLKREIKEGTPFSEEGAHRVKVLGVLFICLSLLTEIAAVVIRHSFSVAEAESLGIVGGMGVGITLLVMSSVLRYGAVIQEMLMLQDVPIPEVEIYEAPPLYENGEPGQETAETPAPEQAAPPETEEVKTE